MKNLILFSLVMSSFSVFASEKICQGTRVIDGSNYTGVVVEVFSNGIAKVKLDSYSGLYDRSVKGLAAAVECKDRFCINDRVIDDSNNPGDIKEIFDNGIAKVIFDLKPAIGLHARSIRGLGKGFRCVENACVNDRVMDGNDPGNIVEIFDNGIAKVKLDSYPGLYDRSLKGLGFKETCSSSAPCRGLNHY